VSLVMVRVPAGTKADRHSHRHEQFVHVVAGSGRFETEQGERAFGQRLLFPAEAWHAASFHTETILIETTFTPRREHIGAAVPQDWGAAPPLLRSVKRYHLDILMWMASSRGVPVVPAALGGREERLIGAP
jgi:cupin domain